MVNQQVNPGTSHDPTVDNFIAGFNDASESDMGSISSLLGYQGVAIDCY